MFNLKNCLILSASVLFLSACALLNAMNDPSASAEPSAQAAELPASDQSEMTAQTESSPIKSNDAIVEDVESTDAMPPKDGIAGGYLASRAALSNADFAIAVQFLQQALAADPENQSLIERATVLYMMSGDIPKAVPLAQKWLAVKQDAVLPNLLLFLHAAKEDDWDTAKLFMTRLEASHLNKLTAPLLKSWMLAATGEGEAAIQNLKPLFVNDAAGGIILLHAALISEFTNQYAEAMGFYTEALARMPVAPLRIAMSAGNLFERTVEPEKAKALYDAFMARSPNNYVFDGAYARIEKGQIAPANVRTAQDGLAQVLFDIATAFEGQQTNESAVVYSQLSSYMNPDFEFNQLLLAELQESYNHFDQAAKIHERLLKHPSFGWAVGLRLARDYEKMGETKRAAELLESLRKKYPKRVEAVTLLGDIHRQNGDYAGAIEAYTAAIENAAPIDANDWPLFYARGTAFERAKMWPQAEKDLLKSLELSPNQPYVLNYLAYSWVDRGENSEKAKDMLMRAVELAPDDGYIIDSLGWLYYRTGDYAAAEPVLQRAVEIRPFDPQLIDHYGDALWRTGKEEQARIQWQRALSFSPEKELQESLEQKVQKGLSAEIKAAKKPPAANPQTSENVMKPAPDAKPADPVTTSQ